MYSTRSDEASISKELLERISRVKDVQHIEFSPEIDAALLRYWPTKNKEQLAKALGIGVVRARKRYIELTEGANSAEEDTYE